MSYKQSAESALRTISKAGRAFEISRAVTAFDDEQGLPVDGEPLRGQIVAVKLPRYKGMIFSGLDDSFKESLIKGKACTLLAAASGVPFEPGPLDIVTINGANWQVIGCTPLEPDGETPIIYFIGIVQV
jgi:hypothetical protein